MLVIGGDAGMGGAARLCAEAALRTGAGLVSCATHPGHAANLLSGRPELMCRGIGGGEALSPMLGRASALALGPGLGRSEWGRGLYKAALATKNLPSVMAAVMLKGVPEYRDGAFQPVAGRKGFVEIFQPLTTHADGNLLNHWKLWAAANRAKRLIAEGREKLFTQADIQEALQLEQKYPFFRDVLNDWQAFNNQLLDLAEDRGIIDPEARQLFAQNDYVPFYRVLEEADQQGPGTGGGLSGAKAKICCR